MKILLTPVKYEYIRLDCFMELRAGEKILKTYRRHYTPFLWISIKVLVSFSPFYLFVYLSKDFVASSTFFWLNAGLFALFAMVFLYIGSMYWLDQLIITDQRIVFKNYTFITVRSEFQASIRDIQDIETREKGVLSHFIFFDYGLLRIETAAATAAIVFENAPDPEGIRHYIFEIRKVHRSTLNPND